VAHLRRVLGEQQAAVAIRRDGLRRGRVASLSVEERRLLRRQGDDRHFGSLLMLAVTAGALLLVVWMSSSKSLLSLESQLARAGNRL